MPRCYSVEASGVASGDVLVAGASAEAAGGVSVVEGDDEQLPERPSAVLTSTAATKRP
jgi:hypothetical protein